MLHWFGSHAQWVKLPLEVIGLLALVVAWVMWALSKIAEAVEDTEE